MGKIKLVIPKGRIFKNVVKLLHDSGINMETNERLYIPCTEDPEIEVKIMKPQNIAQLIELGSHDIGFTGYDWIVETGSEVTEILDLELDSVRVVAAIPSSFSEEEMKKRKIVVASEYENIAKNFLKREKYYSIFLRTHGATEAYPPQDADMIIDNTASGQTLKDHGLKVISTIMNSSTRFIANKEALKDSWKKKKIEEFRMIFKAVINARERVMLEMNVPSQKLEPIVNILPCMRAPTVQSLYKEEGYAVKVAVRKNETAKLIPVLKRMGATDILEYEFRKVIS